MVKVLLGDIAKERKENLKTDKSNLPIVGLEHLVPQQVQLTEWSNDTDNTFTKVFHKGDILFGRRRAYLKKAALWASFNIGVMICIIASSRTATATEPL